MMNFYLYSWKKNVYEFSNIIVSVFLCTPIDKTVQNIFLIKFIFLCTPIDIVYYLLTFAYFFASATFGVKFCFTHYSLKGFV